MFKKFKGSMTEKTERLLNPLVSFTNGIETVKTISIVRKYFVNQQDLQYVEHEISNYADYERLYHQWYSCLLFEQFIGDLFIANQSPFFEYPGYCSVCGEERNFLVNSKISGIPNWRESLVCPDCHCNNRNRFLVSRIRTTDISGQQILIFEDGTTLYDAIKDWVPQLTACQPMGDSVMGNQGGNNIFIENYCDLSFKDAVFDLIISDDVFATIKNWKKAVEEVYRVLKPGGKIIITVPFNPKSEHIEQFEEAQDGSLCQIFGWDVLHFLVQSGFLKTRVKAYYGIEEGYLGYLPLYFEAIKEDDYDKT